MKYFTYQEAVLTDGFLYSKEILNRDVTIHAVYDRFDETGRIGAFRFETDKAHVFWDSDVAKWMEGASYILAKYPDPELEQKVETLIGLIEKNQGADGYFNIHYTIQEPDGRWLKRHNHELYCAGHLFEAAVAYAEATGKERFLHCMEKYADYIYKIFVEEDCAAFSTPGHEEIELALVRMYRYTGKKKYLDLATHFINQRGVAEKDGHSSYDQSHLPVREQTEAVGHAVRAVYLYSAMADLALELEDESLKNACKTLYADIINHKMYITGGIGSCHLGETFSKPYDLPNGQAYTETCAGIGLIFFCQRMLALEHHASYADTIERVLYNGLLSGLSLDGKAFFYENPLEITMLDRFSNEYGTRRYPITQRKEAFSCSCCPPNINRFLPRLAEYIYGFDDDTLYINQFSASKLHTDTIHAEIQTDYPLNGNIRIHAEGVKKIAVRIPAWCDSCHLSVPYTLQNGYALIENHTDFLLTLDMTPFAIRSNPKVIKDTGRLCIQAGPVVYCAEGIDNGENLHAFAVPAVFSYTKEFDQSIGLPILTLDAFRYPETENALYVRASRAKLQPAKLKLIPYHAFANRGESDMLVWFNEKI